VVFPKFGEMFARIADELPLTTQPLMALSDTLRSQWPLLLMGAVTLGAALRTWLVSTPGRRAVDHAKLRWPGLRHVFVPVYLIRLLRPMGLSLRHGVSVVDTLRTCRDAVGNRSIAAFLRQVEHDVLAGQRFAQAVARADFLPPLVVQMLRTGDDSGTLAQVMLRIAGHYERDVARQLQRVSKIAEPLMLLIMGALVGIIVTSLILPIFKLTRAVG
ncbi:MAG: type II secretion system F family protein, partial [Pseudomonadota bacterium]